MGETSLQHHGQIGMTHAKTTGASDKALVHLSPACTYAIYRTVVGPFSAAGRVVLYERANAAWVA